jgi:hypothetical protein
MNGEIRKARFLGVPPPYSQVRAHEVHGWAALESGKASGIGANSSCVVVRGLLRSNLRASSIFVLLATHPSERVRGT